jgi:hypothetical protein
MVGAMQKILFLGLLVFALSIVSFAQVEEAVRYRVNTNVAVVEQQISVSNYDESTGNVILQSKSNSQLEELGSRYAFLKSGSQLEELGSRYAFLKSGSQLEELGSRYAFLK